MKPSALILVLKETLRGLDVLGLPWEFRVNGQPYPIDDDIKGQVATAELSYWNSCIAVRSIPDRRTEFIVLRGGVPLDSYRSLGPDKNKKLFKDYCMTARAARGLVEGETKPPPPEAWSELLEESIKMLMAPKPSNTTYVCGKVREKLRKLKKLLEDERK